MKSALRLRGCLLSDYVHPSPFKAQFKYTVFRGRVKIGPVARRNFIYQEKLNKRAWSQVRWNM